MLLKPFKFSFLRPLLRAARGDASLIILPPHLPSAASPSLPQAPSRLECTFHAFRHCSPRYLRLFSAGVPSFLRSLLAPTETDHLMHCMPQRAK